MRYLATLMLVPVGTDHKLIALSEGDTVYVVMQEDAPDDMRKLGAALAKEGNLAPFAHICILEPAG